VAVSAVTSLFGFLVLHATDDSSFDETDYIIYAAASTALSGAIAGYVGSNSPVYAPARRNFQWLPTADPTHALSGGASERAFRVGLTLTF
jgi:hypothetical protein